MLRAAVKTQSGAGPEEQTPSRKKGKSLPTALTSTKNLIHLRKEKAWSILLNSLSISLTLEGGLRSRVNKWRNFQSQEFINPSTSQHLMQSYELSKQLKVLHIRDVALHSETHLKTHERLFLLHYHFYRLERFRKRKDWIDDTVRRGISLTAMQIYLPLFW